MTNKEFIKSISLEGEEWRDVVGFEGLYMVSSLGRVVALGCIRKNFRNGKFVLRNMSPKLMKQSKMPNNYLFVNLHGYKRIKYFTIHRLVLSTFTEPQEHLQIDHINTDVTDNRLVNLRWVTPKENQNNPISKRHASIAKKGKLHKSSAPIVCLKDGALIKEYDSIVSATQDGFRNTSISHCLKGSIKTHKGFQWMRLKDYEASINKSKNA